MVVQDFKYFVYSPALDPIEYLFQNAITMKSLDVDSIISKVSQGSI